MSVDTLIHARGFPVTAVLFSGMAKTNKLYQWWTTFQELPANVVAVEDPHRVWYQKDIEQSCETLRAHIQKAGGGKVIGIGASAGGFGALMFGAMLKFDAVLGYAAQTCCGATKRFLGDNRWDEMCKNVPEAPSNDLAGLTFPPAVLCYAADDPLDCMHAERVHVTRRKYPCWGHQLPRELARRGKLRPAIARALRRL